MYDILIKNAAVTDGTGAPLKVMDVAVKQGKICLDICGEARETIDASGLVLSPGFVDSHSHSDRLLGREEAGTLSRVSQGITMELTGQCGVSNFPMNPQRVEDMVSYTHTPREDLLQYTDLASFCAYVEKNPPANHFMTYIGHGTLRIAVMGFEARKPTAEELEAMKDLLRKAMEQGAIGMTSGIFYAPGSYADEEELVELCKVVAEYDGIYASHMRNEAADVVECVEETIRVAEKAGCRVDISHHKICGKDNWGKSRETLAVIEAAVARGVKVTIDLYPYTASCTNLNVCLPRHMFAAGPEKMKEMLRDPALRAKLVPEMKEMDGRLRHCGGWDGILLSAIPSDPSAEGKTVADYAKSLGKDPYDAYFDLVAEDGYDAMAIYFSMDEDDLRRILLCEHTVIGTDSLLMNMTDPTHPRGLGAFPKCLRQYVREENLLSLEAMIRKMTGLPAERYGIRNKGLIKEGYDADLVLFDPETVRDCATYTDSLLLADGIERVIVSGETVYQDKKLTGKTPGKFLRYQR